MGVDKLKFELSGFQTLIRDGVQVNLLANTGVDVVDVTSPTPSVTVPAEVLADKLPVTRVMQSVLAVAPGVQQSGAPDLGGGNVGTTTFVAYGLTGQSTPIAISPPRMARLGLTYSF